MNISKNEKFISKAKETHGDKYGYELVNYKTQKDKVNIVCDIHGIFSQSPKSHLRGQGCLLCGREKMKSKLTKKIKKYFQTYRISL